LQDGKYALHNSSYWKGERIPGHRASAHSYNGNHVSGLFLTMLYIRNIEENKKSWKHEELTRIDLYNEYIMKLPPMGCDSDIILGNWPALLQSVPGKNLQHLFQESR